VKAIAAPDEAVINEIIVAGEQRAFAADEATP
jgi:hypothetical protein